MRFVKFLTIIFFVFFTGSCNYKVKNNELIKKQFYSNNKCNLIVNIGNGKNYLNQHFLSLESFKLCNKEGDCLYISLLYSTVINYREGMIKRITFYDILGNQISDCFVNGDKIDGTLYYSLFDSIHMVVSSVLTFKNGEIISESNYYKDELNLVYKSMVNYNNTFRLSNKKTKEIPVSLKTINCGAFSTSINNIEHDYFTLDCFSETGEKVVTYKKFFYWISVFEYIESKIAKITYFDLWGNLLSECSIDGGKANGTIYSVGFGLQGLKESTIISFKDGEEVSTENLYENEIQEIFKALGEYKKKIHPPSCP